MSSQLYFATAESVLGDHHILQWDQPHKPRLSTFSGLPTRRESAHGISICHSTIIQHIVWQPESEWVASKRFFLLQNKRHSRWTSARELRLCIGVLGVSAADAQVQP